ncbi:MAG: hypothetical protein IT580_11350 [Verrucomicrobiales bacterium]|nr:hypothetical protein [Verrucomicrobiales bacterium]
MKLTRRHLITAGPLLVPLFFSGCISPPKPVYDSTLWSPADVDSIALLPLVDLRPEKVKMSDFNRIGQKAMRKQLKHWKYTCVVSDQAIPENTGLEESFLKPSKEWVSALPEPGQRWIMVAVIHDVTRRITFGSVGNAEVSVHLFDRSSGLRVWQAKGLGQAGQGGVVGMLMVGMMDEDALMSALGNALFQLPRRDKK